MGSRGPKIAASPNGQEFVGPGKSDRPERAGGVRPARRFVGPEFWPRPPWASPSAWPRVQAHEQGLERCCGGSRPVRRALRRHSWAPTTRPAAEPGAQRHCPALRLEPALAHRRPSMAPPTGPVTTLPAASARRPACPLHLAAPFNPSRRPPARPSPPAPHAGFGGFGGFGKKPVPPRPADVPPWVADSTACPCCSGRKFEAMEVFWGGVWGRTGFAVRRPWGGPARARPPPWKTRNPSHYAGVLRALPGGHVPAPHPRSPHAVPLCGVRQGRGRGGGLHHRDNAPRQPQGGGWPHPWRRPRRLHPGGGREGHHETCSVAAAQGGGVRGWRRASAGGGGVGARAAQWSWCAPRGAGAARWRDR